MAQRLPQQRMITKQEAVEVIENGERWRIAADVVVGKSRAEESLRLCKAFFARCVSKLLSTKLEVLQARLSHLNPLSITALKRLL